MSRDIQTERPYLNAAQVAVIRDLSQRYGIDPTGITFLNNGEPWLTSRMRLEIARQSEEFQSVDENFDQMIPQLNQVVHSAEVIDRDGRRFRRSGVAAIGERLPNSEIADEHELAASRALGAALDAAGFNPLGKTRSAISPDRRAAGITMVEDPAETRLNQLGQIHLLAEQAGLIFRTEHGKNLTAYREFLAEHYGVTSVAGMTETDRASVIAALRVKCRELA